MNVVAPGDGRLAPGTNGIGGRIIYSGNTFFRTRVPIRPNRTPGASFNPEKDFTSDYIVQPFRYFERDLTTGQFNLFDFQAVDTKVAYSGAGFSDPVNDPDKKVAKEITDSSLGDGGFRRENLKERSVAATRWIIELDDIDISKVTDIELIISHRSSPRATVTN